MRHPHTGRIVALDGLRAVAVTLVIAGHGVDAYGTPMAPSLNNPTFLSETPDAAIFQIIAGGVSDTLMPAWGARLTEQEINTLVAYLRSLEGNPQPILQP